jgi:WD40 repeat protein
MASVFVSYSRKDITFAKRLTAELQKCELDFWIDWEGIPPTVDWWKEIEKGIEEADIFLFLISPDSSTSKVCGQEIDTAVKNAKRIIPIVVRDIKGDEAPKSLSHLNWIFCRESDDFDAAFQKLLTSIHTDYEWVKEHRWLQVRALDWQRENKDRGALLRGKDLLDAETNLAINSSKEPHPTDLQREYVLQSRKATDRQRGILTSLSIAGILALAALAAYGFYQAGQATNNAANAQANLYVAQTAQVDAQNKQLLADNNASTAVVSEQKAIEQAKISRAGELSGLAISEKDTHYWLGLLLSIEGIKKQDNIQTESTLFSLINSHAGLYRYLFGDRGSISSIAFSPDGRIMASGSNIITLWDVSIPSDPIELSASPIQSETIASMAFSADSKMLASGGSDGTIVLWDVTDSARPTILSTLSEHTDNVSSVAFSPRGELLASASEDGNIILWDVSHPTSPSKLSNFSGRFGDAIYSVAFNPDGTILASGGLSNIIILWDVSNPANPTELSSFSVPYGDTPNEALIGIYSTAFTPDGKSLATARTWGRIFLWDVSNARAPSELSVISGHGPITFSPDGRMLVSSEENGTIKLWDVSELSHPITIYSSSGHNDFVSGVAFSPDGKMLVSGSRDGTIILWDVQNPISLAQLSVLSGGSGDSYLGVLSVAFSSDGKKMASGNDDGTLMVWDVRDTANPIILSNLQSKQVSSMALSPDGKTLASGHTQGTFILWDLSNSTHPVKLSTQQAGYDVRIVFSPNGRTLASGSASDKNIILWDVTNPANPVKLSTLFESISSSVALSPNGKMLASEGIDSNIILWDVTHPANPVKLAALSTHTGRVLSVTFSPNGKMIASGSDDSNIMLWDVTNPTNPVKLSTFSGNIRAVSSLSFSHDGNKLAAGSYDATIVIWDIHNLVTPVKLFTLSGHKDAVYSIALSPDDKTLVSGSNDNTIILWDLDLGSWVQKACQRAGRNFTHAEWTQYFPNEKYRKTCDQWPLEPEATPTLTPTP